MINIITVANNRPRLVITKCLKGFPYMKSSTLKMSAQGIKLRTIRIEHYLYVSAFLVCDQNSLRTSLHLVFQGVIKRKIPRLIAGFAPFTNHSLHWVYQSIGNLLF